MYLRPEGLSSSAIAASCFHTEPGFRGVDMPSVIPSAGWISLSAARNPANKFDALLGTRSGQSERDSVFLLAKGRLKPGVTREMAGFTAMTQRMKAQLAEMLTEHKSIVAGAMEHREHRPAG